MGWTGCHATHYKRNGDIDRKAECDGYFLEGLNAGHYRILKSVMVGSIYYAAIQNLKRYAGRDDAGNSIYEDIPEQQQTETWAMVIITQTDRKDYFNFYHKEMDETMGPCYYDCPMSILKLLSPTDNKYALSWRGKCKQRAEQKKSPDALSKLPVGTTIQFKWGDEVKTYVKHEPAYQFKRPFWYDPDKNVYIPAKRIPSDYQVIR